MKFANELLVSELEEGKVYPITVGGNGYSDGVWITKTGDEIQVRNFWDKDVSNNEGYYRYDEKDDVCYPNDKNLDLTIVVHKDLLTVIPECASFTFEDMSLIAFYEIVIVNGLEMFRDNDYVAPKQIKGKLKIYNGDFKLIESI